MTGPARFTVRLAGVCLVVACVVGLGLLWRASPAAGVVSYGHGDHAHRSAPSTGPAAPDRFDRRSRSLDVTELVQPLVVTGLAVGVVVAIDRRRRVARVGPRPPRAGP